MSASVLITRISLKRRITAVDRISNSRLLIGVFDTMNKGVSVTELKKVQGLHAHAEEVGEEHPSSCTVTDGTMLPVLLVGSDIFTMHSGIGFSCIARFTLGLSTM